MKKFEKQFGLLAFKVRMDLSDSTPRIVCALLQGRKNSGVKTIKEWICETEDLGIPRRFDSYKELNGGSNFRLPQILISGLKAKLSKLNREGRPLWLHIARPNGILGLVPWEQLLQPELGISILRLPDFLDRPGRDNLTDLRVVLCASSPVAKGGIKVARYLCSLCESIIAGGPGDTRIEIFTDADSTARVQELLFARMSDALTQVTVHDPEEMANYEPTEATTRISGRGGRVENPWLLWMTDALIGKAIDVVHIVGHGFLSGAEGSVALAESPVQNYDLRMARFVGAAELGTFLNRVGAWSVAFSSPERNYSEMGLRLLADNLGQMRPGPVLYHEVENDEQFVALTTVYQFLFAKSGVPPAHPGLFLYCHPSYVEAEPHEEYDPFVQVKSIIPDLAWQTLGSGLAETQEQWISATERYLEQRSLEAARAVVAAHGRGGETTAFAMAKEQVETANTVSRMREMMEKVAIGQKDRAK